MQLLLTNILVWRQSQNPIRLLPKPLWLVQSQKLKECAFIVLQFCFQIAARGLQWLDASVILPDEALKLCRAVREFWWRLAQNLVAFGLVHIVSLGLAPLCGLVSLYKGVWRSVKLLKFEISRSWIIAQRRCNGKIFTPCVEHHVGRLALWSANVHGSHIYGIILAFQRYL